MDGATGLEQPDLWPDLSREIGLLTPASGCVRARTCTHTHLQKWQLMAATQTTNLPSVE